MTGQPARTVLALSPRLWPYLVATALCCCASSARASCGDYVRHERSVLKHQADTKNGAPWPTAPMPCRGLGCSRGHEKAPFTLPSTLLVRLKENALTVRTPLIDASSSYLGTAPRDHVHPIHRCFPVERPPRA
jgi:hypothetical protein